MLHQLHQRFLPPQCACTCAMRSLAPPSSTLHWAPSTVHTEHLLLCTLSTLGHSCLSYSSLPSTRYSTLSPATPHRPLDGDNAFPSSFWGQDAIKGSSMATMLSLLLPSCPQPSPTISPEPIPVCFRAMSIRAMYIYPGLPHLHPYPYPHPYPHPYPCCCCCCM